MLKILLWLLFWVRCVIMKLVIKMCSKVIYRQRGKDQMYKVWHTSDEYLIMYINSGEGSIVSGEKIFPLNKGMLVFIAANTYHYTMPEHPEKYERSKILIPPSKFAKLTELIKQNVFKKSIICAQIDECEQNAVDEIFTECDRYQNNDWILTSAFYKLLYFLDKYMTETIQASEGGVSAAIKYINENISNELDIDKICENIHISKYHFCRQFKEHTGMTVMKYILKTRIVLAKIELRTSTLSIGEISEKYGFSSIAYFCRVFKEEENCSPLKYRKGR